MLQGCRAAWQRAALPLHVTHMLRTQRSQQQWWQPLGVPQVAGLTLSLEQVVSSSWLKPGRAQGGAFFVSASNDGTCRVWDCRRLERDVSFRSRLTFAPQVHHSELHRGGPLCAPDPRHVLQPPDIQPSGGPLLA